MKTTRIQLLSALTIVFFMAVFNVCQAQADEVEPFQSGVYLSATSFLKNKPDVAFSQLCNKKGEAVKEIDFTRNGYYLQGGEIIPFKADSVHAYCNDGIVFMGLTRYGERYFERLVLVKTLSLFVVNVRVPSATGFGAYGMVTGGSQYEQVQMVYSFETGKVVPFDAVSALGLFAKDEQLLQEYTMIKRNKKKKKKYYYLNLYNQRHPLVYPVLK